jgi:signal transduction histidine kinase
MINARVFRGGAQLLIIYILLTAGQTFYVFTYNWDPATPTWGIVVGSAFPAAAALIFITYTIFHYMSETDRVLLDATGIGTVIGAGLVLAPSLGIAIQQEQVGSPILNADILLLESAVGGALIGLVAGHFYGLVILEQRELEAQTQRLTQHRERLAVLNRILRHDIRNHINVILGNVDLLPQRENDAEIQANIESHSRRIIEISQNARQIETSLTEDERHTTTRIQEIVSDAVDTTTVDVSDAIVDIQLPDNTRVQSNGHLDSAVRNVIENAVEHNDSPEPEVTIAATTDAANETVSLEIADNGPGIPSAEQKPFHNGEDQLQHSSGLGLWLTHWALQDVGGDITFQPREPRGTIVSLHIPTATLDADAGMEQKLTASDD